MQSATISTYRPSGKFSLPGMLLTLAGGIGVGAVGGLAIYLISSVIHFSIPFLFPAALGAAVGYETATLGKKYGRCRSQLIAIGVAVIAGVAAWSSEYVIDYAKFHADVFNSIAAQVPQASSRAIDIFIDQRLREETGQSSLIGFMLLKAQSESLEITHFFNGAGIGGLTLTGPALFLYWLVELLIVVGLAGYLNCSYPLEPYCEQCNTWRKCKVPIVGSAERISEAVEALRRRDITAAAVALGKYEQGDLARLEMEFCPVCYDNPYTNLVVVGDTTEQKVWIERKVWSDRLDPSTVQRILQLSQY